jgi:D-amino-acid dehydrogenase
MKTTIVGGGIIGLCSAYYLSEAGTEVEVIDQSDFTDGCSFGNAGMIVPSHFTPMATPGVIAKGLRWMFDSKSPFYIKPRLNAELLQWLWKFYQSCSKEKVDRAIPVLRNYQFLSKQLYQELAKKPELDFLYKEVGLLMLYKTAKAEEEEKSIAELANEVGIEAKILNSVEVEKLETGTSTNVLGGIYYPGDAHLSPNRLMKGLVSYLKKRGVIFRDKTTVTGFKYQKDKIEAILTNKGIQIPVENLVVAGGAWTPKILKFLGIKMLLQDGKGYSITLKNTVEKITIPSLLAEAKVAMTPMGNDLRIGGTLEISNLSQKINLLRMAGILEAVPKYYPELKQKMPPKETIWHGYRPCPPDGLPYMGRSKKYKNLVIATGHAMMGMSLGPASGKLVAEIIQNDSTSLNLTLLDPNRF